MKYTVHRPSDGTGRRSGFTLAEILMVVLIIGVLSAVAVPSLLSRMPIYRMDRAAAQVDGHLRGARLQSMSEGVPVAVVFDAGGQVYRVGLLDADGTMDEDEQQARRLPAADAVTFTVAAVARGVFFPDGSFRADGERASSVWVVLSSSATDQQRSVVIWPSGAVRQFDHVWGEQ